MASAVRVVGLLAAVLLAGQRQSKGIHFVISDSGRNISVTRSPVEGTVHDRWPIDYCASAREVPEDLPGFPVQCIHLP